MPFLPQDHKATPVLEALLIYLFNLKNYQLRLTIYLELCFSVWHKSHYSPYICICKYTCIDMLLKYMYMLDIYPYIYEFLDSKYTWTCMYILYLTPFIEKSIVKTFINGILILYMKYVNFICIFKFNNINLLIFLRYY